MNEEPALPSLLDRAPPLPGLALDGLTPDERSQGEGTAAHPCGEFSAARFHALYPERYAMIARALAEGFSLEAAARVFRIHERTAAAIREREARSLAGEAYRGIQARHARAVVLAATDEIARRLREAPGEIGVRDLVAAVRELHNVERALEGAPSQVVGVIRADGASAALADLLQQASAAARDGVNGFGRAEKRPREDGEAGVEDAEIVATTTGETVAATEQIGALIDSQSLTLFPENHVFTTVCHVVDTAKDADNSGRGASSFDATGTADASEDRARIGAGWTIDAGVADGGAADGRGATAGEERRATGAGGGPAKQGGPVSIDESAPENFGHENQDRSLEQNHEN